jgi:hypothetical protein
MVMESFLYPFRKAKFCGAQKYVFEKSEWAEGAKSLSNTEIQQQTSYIASTNYTNSTQNSVTSKLQIKLIKT